MTKKYKTTRDSLPTLPENEAYNSSSSDKISEESFYLEYDSDNLYAGVGKIETPPKEESFQQYLPLETKNFDHLFQKGNQQKTFPKKVPEKISKPIFAALRKRFVSITDFVEASKTIECDKNSSSSFRRNATLDFFTTTIQSNPEKSKRIQISYEQTKILKDGLKIVEELESENDSKKFLKNLGIRNTELDFTKETLQIAGLNNEQLKELQKTSDPKEKLLFLNQTLKELKSSFSLIDLFEHKVADLKKQKKEYEGFSLNLSDKQINSLEKTFSKIVASSPRINFGLPSTAPQKAFAKKLKEFLQNAVIRK